jgi:hypothetical protein
VRYPGVRLESRPARGLADRGTIVAKTRTAFGRLLDALRSQRVYVPTTLTFSPLDIPAMVERLRLVERGEENGRQSRPPSDSLQPDRVEAEIAGLIKDEYDRALDIHRQGQAAYDRRIYGTSLDTLAVEIRGEAQDAVAEYTRVSLQAQDEISLDRKDLDDVEKEFDNFKTLNRLARGCRSPEGHVTHIGTILLILLLDTMANGYLLSGRDEFGLLGGMIQAILVAGMNIGFGFFAGRFAVPNVVHRSFWRRSAGLIGLALLFGLILALNLSFAHYRDLSVLGVADAEQKALSEMLQTPLVLRDVKSWWLGCVGVMFAIVALIDGFNWDDHYPGYGERARRRESKREDYLDRKNYWFETIKSRREQARAEVSEIRREIDKIQGEIGQASMGSRSFTASFHAHVSNLEAAGNQLIGIYRDANRRVRAIPAPPYFDQAWQLTRTDVPVPTEIDRDLLRKQVESITASLSEALDQIHRTHDETIRAFDRLDGRNSRPPEPVQADRVVPPEPRPFAPSEPRPEG